MGPFSSYFTWNEWIHQTRAYPMWHVQISASNTPGLVALIGNLDQDQENVFRYVFHGDNRRAPRYAAPRSWYEVKV